MSGHRAITGEAADHAAQRRREGQTVEGICRELGSRFGVEASERTLRRMFASMGIEAPKRPRRHVDPRIPVLKAALVEAAAEASGSPASASLVSDVPTPDRKPAGAPHDERALLLRHIETLEQELTLAIPSHDKATIVRTLAGLAARVTAIDTAAAKITADRDDPNGDGAWVLKKLENFAAMRRRAQEAVIAVLPPEQAAAARRVLAADSYVAEVTDDGQETHAKAG